jgi:Family of unknown function (DUF6216)
MDLTTLSSLSGAVAIAAPLCMVALFVWVIFRTESRHTLRFRLWQLIQGNREISDPAIRNYVDEQNSLMSFRFIAGVPVRDLEHAHQLIEWTKLRNVEMYALRMAGEYFDSEHRVIDAKKLPHKFSQGIKLFLASLAIPVVLLCSVLIYSDSAVMSIKATGRWMLMREAETKAAWPLMQTPLTKTHCAAGPAPSARETSFTDQEVTILCQVLAGEGTASYVQKSVQGQWKSALVLLIETLVATYLLCASFMSGFVARRLAKRELDPSLGDGQAEQPLRITGQGVKPEAIAAEEAPGLL